MRIGKVSENVLKRSILKRCQTKQEDMVQGPGVGRDCAIFHVDGKQQMASAIQVATADMAVKVQYLICHTVNNLLCSGAKPCMVSLSIMLEPQAEEAKLRAIMDMARECCNALHISLAGGHTQVSEAVHQTVVTVSAVGFCKKEALLSAGLCPGLEIVMAGFAGMEGTAILAQREEKRLLEKFPLDLVEEAKGFDAHLFLQEEAETALLCDAMAMHDISQGGVFGALWELGESAGVGMEVELKKILLKQETVEISEFFGLNPYCLLSGGAMLIAVRDGQRLVMELAKKGIRAAVIGRTTDKKDKVLLNGEECRFLEKPAQDEIFKVC